MTDIQAYRAAHLLGSLTIGLSGGATYALLGSPLALVGLALLVPAVLLTSLTWDRMVKMEYAN